MRGKGNPIPTRSRQLVQGREEGRCLRCGGRGTDWHHRRRRNVKDQHQHCPCNGVLLCRTCHNEAHASPFTSKRDGFIVAASIGEPGGEPVKAWYGDLFLQCNGTVRFKVSE